jgi:hypothetical protein
VKALREHLLRFAAVFLSAFICGESIWRYESCVLPWLLRQQSCSAFLWDRTENIPAEAAPAQKKASVLWGDTEKSARGIAMTES